MGASARIAVVRSDYSASNLSVPGHGRGRSGIGASRPLRRIPAIVSFLNPQPALSLVGGNRSSCPIPAVRNTVRIGSAAWKLSFVLRHRLAEASQFPHFRWQTKFVRAGRAFGYWLSASSSASASLRSDVSKPSVNQR